MNSRELYLDVNDFIVTKTDKSGRITYCNDAFMEFSGFLEEDLLGKNDDVIYHDEMPRSVFQLMKDTLQQENEFIGIIKNKRKNGGAFWSFINVTPSFDSKNQLLGYLSIHRYPHAKAIDFFAPLYQEMLAKEQQLSGSANSLDESLHIMMSAVAISGDYNEHVSSYYR